MTTPNPLRVGIGGPVGSGKTALCEMLCKKMRDDYDMAVITNDIYTREDMEILLRADALPANRLMGVETGGCPHTAIREDASINLEAIARMSAEFPDLDLILVESGGDLAPHVGANLDIMASDAKKMRGDRPFVFTNLRKGDGVDTVIDFIRTQGLLDQ